MKINARTSESPAPVDNVYIPHKHMIIAERSILIFLLLPNSAKDFDKIPYMIPRCRPDNASMCDAPLSRKAFFISSDKSALSPVNKAFVNEFVLSESKGKVSINLCIASPNLLQWISNPDSGMSDILIAVAAESAPHPKAATAISEYMKDGWKS